MFDNDNYTNLHVGTNTSASCSYQFVNSSGQGSSVNFKGGEQDIAIPSDCVTINITIAQYTRVYGIEFS